MGQLKTLEVGLGGNWVGDPRPPPGPPPCEGQGEVSSAQATETSSPMKGGASSSTAAAVEGYKLLSKGQ